MSAVPSSTSPKTQRIAVCVLGLAMFLTGCRTDSDLNRFDQTWEQPLDETTCADWTETMTATQRFAAAAELLLSAREGMPGFPSDSQFTFFMSRITAGCDDAGAEASASEVAQSVYSEREGQLSQ